MTNTVDIKFGNITFKIDGAIPAEVNNKIAKKLSYEVGGFGQPKETFTIYNIKTQMSYTGVLPYAIQILKRNNINVNLKDVRKPIQNEDKANFKLADNVQLRDYQQDALNTIVSRNIIQAATGAGKAMPLDTEILTPNGFVQLKDIHPGSIIYDAFGKKTIVTAEYFHSNKNVYEITFNDGTSAKCCEDHLWKYCVMSNRNVWKVDSLKNILNKYSNIYSSGHGYKLAIPVCQPIEFDKKDLIVNPYVLGALLGNGSWTTKAITFTNIEQDIIDKMNNLVSEYGYFKHRSNPDHIQLSFIGGRNNVMANWIHNTFNHCKADHKFIPEEYKMSSIDDRVALIQGLVDTDGYVDHKGHIHYSTISEQLAKDFQFVIRSLGYRCTIHISDRTKDNKGISYNIIIKAKDNKLFSSIKHNSKFDVAKETKHHYYNLLKIVSIKKLDEKVNMKCLTVDSDDHTYICNDFIVTHNTCIMAAAIAKFNVKPVVIISPKATLAYQLQNEISLFLGIKVGIMTGMDEDIQDITVCTPQMALKSELLSKCKAIMYDECQFLAGKTIFNTARAAKNAYYRLAVSATPWRDSGDDVLIEAAINTRNPKSNISASKLILKDKLTSCQINFVKFHHDLGWQGNYGATYNACIVNNNKRNQTVVNLVKKHKNDIGTTLVLFSRVEHGEILKNMIRKQVGNTTQNFIYNGNIYKINSVELVNGSTPMEERTVILAAAKEGIVRVLLGSTIADEGLDVPILKTLILAGSGKSSTRAFQRIGRVLRLYDGLKMATVYDFYDDNPTFYHHYLYRRALYGTEPEWEKNIKTINAEDILK